VGTRDGIAVLRADDGATPLVDRVVARGVAVRALAFVGDTLWAGTDAGLVTLRPGDERPQPVGGDARLSRPIAAIAWSDSLVAVATDDDLLRFSGGRSLPRIAALDVRALGGVRALAVDGEALWIVGARGAVEVDRASDVARSVSAAEMGGALHDVLLTDAYVWLAGDAGLSRLARVGGRIR
jgi:hypothetical protein